MKVALASLEDRALEWFCAIFAIWLGLCLLMPGDMLESPRFAELTRYGIPEDFLGYLIVAFGWGRLFSLYINGRKAVTPYARISLAMLCFLVWAPLASASFESAYMHPAGLLRGITSVGAGGGLYCLLALSEILSVYRAAIDSRYLPAKHGNLYGAQ